MTLENNPSLEQKLQQSRLEANLKTLRIKSSEESFALLQSEIESLRKQVTEKDSALRQKQQEIRNKDVRIRSQEYEIKKLRNDLLQTEFDLRFAGGKRDRNVIDGAPLPPYMGGRKDSLTREQVEQAQRGCE